MKHNSRSWRVLGLAVVALAGSAIAIAEPDQFQQVPEKRVELGVGESNWVPLEPGAAGRAVITTDDLNPPGITTAAQMVAALLGALPPGTTVANATFSGVNIAGGTFNNAVIPIGINSGVILSSGNIASVIGGPFGACNRLDWTTTNNGQPGDAMLTALLPAPQATLDRAALEFDINPGGTARILGFRFVFASECHNEWVNSRYNDACAIFVTAPGGTVNVALVPFGGDAPFIPVTVNNVNCGNPFPGTGRNCALYVNNDCSDGLGGFPCAPPNRETEMDGLTRVFPAQATLLNPNVNYHVKLVVGDTGDRAWDSDFFVKGTARGGRCYNLGGGARGTCVCEDGVDQADCTDPGDVWEEGQFCDTANPCSFTTGGCCQPSDVCAVMTPTACATAGGTFFGLGTDCAGIICALPATGACCAPGGACAVTTEAACVPPGTYQGDATDCTDLNNDGIGDTCGSAHPIPAVSEWGLAVLLLLVLCVGTVVFDRRRRAARAV